MWCVVMYVHVTTHSYTHNSLIHSLVCDAMCPRHHSLIHSPLTHSLTRPQCYHQQQKQHTLSSGHQSSFHTFQRFLSVPPAGECRSGQVRAGHWVWCRSCEHSQCLVTHPMRLKSISFSDKLLHNRKNKSIIKYVSLFHFLLEIVQVLES